MLVPRCIIGFTLSLPLEITDSEDFSAVVSLSIKRKEIKKNRKQLPEL